MRFGFSRRYLAEDAEEHTHVLLKSSQPYLVVGRSRGGGKKRKKVKNIIDREKSRGAYHQLEQTEERTTRRMKATTTTLPILYLRQVRIRERPSTPATTVTGTAIGTLLPPRCHPPRLV